MSQTIGGGAKKVLYTLQTAARIGLLDATKALAVKNACKACWLGMGGQKGGMTNDIHLDKWFVCDGCSGW